MNPRCPVCDRPGKPAGDYFQCPQGHGFFEPDDEVEYSDPERTFDRREQQAKYRKGRR